MHPAKLNYRKMHLNNLECSQGCPEPEDQRHIFGGCNKLDSKQNANIYDFIFEDICKQKEAIIAFICIERRRKELNMASSSYNNDLLPGGANSRTLISTSN